MAPPTPIALALIVCTATRAAAQPGLVPPSTDTPKPPAAGIESPLEPGTLGLGHVGARVGVGLGNGPLGLGGEVAVGLGGVDVLASAGYLPPFCVNLGELGGGCDPAQVFLGFGAQAK